jgi:exodeoxyribonuclease VII small subunit
VADFEAALSELERIVQQLESGSLGLEPSMARFEQGIALLRQCYETLETAEQRIELLTGMDADGNPRTAPFPAAETEVEVSVQIEQTEIEIASERPAPRKGSVEKRVPEADPDDAAEDADEGPRLF